MIASEKFVDDLTIGDWTTIEEISGVALEDMESANQLRLTVAFLVVAKRKTGEEYNVSDANKLKINKLETEYTGALKTLGYEDDAVLKVSGTTAKSTKATVKQNS